jgi:hypothetical protein
MTLQQHTRECQQLFWVLVIYQETLDHYTQGTPLCMQPLCTTVIRYTVYCCALWALLPAQQLPQVPSLKDIKVAYKPDYGGVLQH